MWGLSPELLQVFGSGLIAFFVASMTMVWRISSAKSSIEEKIVVTEHEAELKLAKLKEDILNAKLEAFTIFIHKDSFEAAMKSLEARLLRLETKIDKVLENNG